MKRPKWKPTIYDVAQASGISASTVSAVLSGNSVNRRIKQGTVELVRKVAAEVGYSANLQARGLRRARSGLVGMIIPMHENRFFSSLSQSFDTLARERGFCPVIASTLRDAKEEARVVETLISYAVDSLFIAGATDPDALGELCAAARLPHVFIDLPGKHAPSVVTNNRHGAELLARKIFTQMLGGESSRPATPYFFGGLAGDYATTLRIEAFRSVAAEFGLPIAEDQILQCGYAPRNAADAIVALCGRLGGLPAGLFVNSLTVFEGVMGHFVKLPSSAFDQSVIGCFDYDPFAAFLQFPVYMIRQNSHELIARGYQLLESDFSDAVIEEIEPDLIEPRTLYKSPLAGIG